ncbi:PAS domain-containing sensor histidine kinase [Paraglaciecola sp. MB-3u-78]|uniref:hybrid sensor histidine kinase/response regulator n=1 Tax=Paraglaciecola sp. MB-3u-78 TaxID=2058332 RepID=UPI000C31BC61|nr:PAS domain-containing sensor histidine kinase [Paraglaciecola sp. MB-3u-78]PKG93223.1 histidine kinase [Paraglaciecola sp. MB-3u-78]
MNQRSTQTDAELRQRAERLPDASPEGKRLTSSSSETKQLLHELLVHQIELDMQNEELRSAQQQLEVSKARYFDLYDLAPVGYLTLDERHLIKECNLFVANMMGVNRNKLIKAPISKILLKEDQIIFYDNLKATLEMDITRHFEMRLVRADGEFFWGLLHVVAMKCGEYWVTVTDISRNKQVEAELQESDNKFRSVFEQAAMGVARMGLDGAWLEVNQKLCAIVGYSQHALLSKGFQDLIHPEELPREQAAICQLINNEISTYAKEKRYYTGAGSIVWLKVTMNLVRDINNDPDYFIAIIEDITSQKTEEAKQLSLTEQLHQAQKTEAIGKLAGGISHDFNNMLGVILGQAEWLTNKLEPASPLMDHIQSITKAAEHSAKLTRQLLTFARKQTIEPKVLDLNKSVSAMMDMLKQLIGESIQVSWDPAQDLWPVKVDPTQIDQVLANLCINARDAISGNGHISISTRNCRLDEHFATNHSDEMPPGDYVKLSVSDDGCGMNNPTKAQIFEPFYTTKAPGSGTGLGLSFTLGAVQMNAGFINVFSEPEQGTTFHIYFKKVKSPEEMKQKITDAPYKKGTETILLVEDEEMLLEIETAMLENSGYTVLAASSGDHAEALFREHLFEINLLMTDVIMPEINGMDLAVQLQALTPNLQVIFMSGYPQDILGNQANLEEGASFLQKPFSMEALANKVREVLDADEDKHPS